MKTTRTLKAVTSATKAPAEDQGIPPPQVLAMQVYAKMVQEGSVKDASPEATAALMKDALTAAVECACKAQRAADALLIEVIGDARLGVGDKDFATYLCGVLRGTINPAQDLGRASGLIKAGLV